LSGVDAIGATLDAAGPWKRMAVVRGLPSDGGWSFPEPLVIERGPRRGRPSAGRRRVLDAVFRIAAIRTWPGRVVDTAWSGVAGGAPRFSRRLTTLPFNEGRAVADLVRAR
jgi:hypothetical protein